MARRPKADARKEMPPSDPSLGRILVLDDDERAAQELCYLLSRSVTCHAEPCAKPSAAVKQILESTYDLVVTDLNMPGRDGLSVLAEIKALSPRCEVIVLTAYSSMRSAIASIKLGAVDYIVRDAGTAWFEQLVQASRMALRIRPSGRAPGFHRENLIHFFLERVGTGKTSADETYGHFPAGLALEYGVKLLLESCDGFETTWHRRRTASEEHDIVGLNQVKHGFWERQGSIVLVECKDYGSSRPGANERGRFEEKIRNRIGQSTLGIFVSPSGFAKTFIHPVLRVPVAGSTPPIIITIDGEGLQAWRNAFDRLSWLTERAVASIF